MSGSPNAVLVYAIWTLAPDAPPLTDALIERLAPYVTRWAKTLGVTVWAVGGTSGELHLLFDAPVDRALQSVTSELQAATTRFASDTLDVHGLLWQSVSYEGVGTDEKEDRIGYIHTIAALDALKTARPKTNRAKIAAEETDETPSWLREALAASKARD